VRVLSIGCWVDKSQTPKKLESWKQPCNIMNILRCALTNNYVNDIRNYRYALAVVKFLREELVQLESGASLA